MEEDEIEVQVETLEFGLYEEEIDELIEMLKKLKETKGKFSFDIDDENELVIHYSKDED
jgi:hypothetical protein